MSPKDTIEMWNEALELMPEASGPGKHLVLVAPTDAYDYGCYLGLASVGNVWYYDANGEAKHLPNTVFVSGLNQKTLAHELGHNLGLLHSNSLRCSGTQDMPMVSKGFPGCVTKEYDDMFDVMGHGYGNLNAVHLDGMNLLPNAVRRITASPATDGPTCWPAVTPGSSGSTGATAPAASLPAPRSEPGGGR